MDYSKIFFIGIGGISLSSLALFCKDQGLKVCGSDVVRSATTKLLENNNIKVFYKHKAKNIIGFDCVVYTDAISNNNQELAMALKQNIKVFRRAEFLQYVLNLFNDSVAVCGCHGKTTTTAMLHFALKEVNPTTHLGGIVDEKNFFNGEKGLFITEACEYKKNLLHLKPNNAIILNIGLDHMDCFKNLKDVKNTFQKFANQVKNVLVVNGDDINCRNIKHKNKITFGFGSQNDFCAKNIKCEINKTSFDLFAYGKKTKRATINVGLEHNILNALAVFALCDTLKIKNYFNNILFFNGVDRRNQFIKKFNGATIIHDYAHHPKEIQDIILNHKKFCTNKLYVVFEAHTFSRTLNLINEFKTCFKQADKTFILPIYPAREKPIKNVNGKFLARQCGGEFICCYKKFANTIRKILKENDVLLVLGAGNIFKLANMI